MAPYSAIPPPPVIEKPTIVSISALPFEIAVPSTWPKWFTALVIGIPLSAVCLGTAYYFSSMRRRSVRKPGNNSNKAGRSEASSSKSGVDSSTSSSEPVTVQQKINDAKNEGNKLFRAKKYTEAKRFYEEAIVMCRENGVTEELSQCLQNRAACNEQLKLFGDVMADCDAAIQLNPRYIKAYARRSRAHEKLGNKIQALHDLIAASILSDFKNGEYKERSEKILSALAMETAANHIKKRALNGGSGRLSRAFVRQFSTGFARDPITKAIEKVAEYPEDDALSKALVAYRDEKYVESLALAREASRTEGKERQLAWLLSGTLNFLLGNIDQAVTDLDNAVKHSQSSLKEKSNARIKLACIVLQKTMNPELVISQLSEALEADPTNPDILFHRAQCQMIFGRLEECLADFKLCEKHQSASQKPTSAFHVAHIEYRIRSQTNPMDFEALHKLEERLAPLDNPEGYVLLAQLFMEMQRFDRADFYFKKALRPGNDAHNAVVYTQQALLEMLAHEDRKKATDLLKKALEVDENYSGALELMMDIELQAGNLPAARVLYERILSLAKSEAEMVGVIQAFQLGEAGQAVYEKLGISDREPIPLGANSSMF